MESPAHLAPRLHVGVWVDQDAGDKYTADLLAFLASQPALFQVTLIVTGTLSREAPLLSRALWRLIGWEERKFLRNHPLHRDHLNRQQLTPLVANTLTLADNAAAADRLAEMQLDLAVVCGRVGPSPQTLATIRLGALALTGMDGCTDGAPLGFWECYKARAKSGFLITAQSADGPPQVLQHGFYSSRRRFLLNQADLQYKANAHYKQLLLAIARRGALPPPQAVALAPAVPQPGAMALVGFAARLLARKLVDKVRLQYLRSTEVWGISFMHGRWDQRPLPALITPPVPEGHFWADPFLLEQDGRTYCFLEDYDYARALGHISVLELREHDCVNLGPCLIEPFHLSFPYLFRYEGALYMCPEASQSDQVRVYRCLDFPLRWELAAVLMEGVSAADSMLFEQDGRWWMLTNIDQARGGDHCSELQLFYADSPLSTQWTAHPMNPLRIDAEGGRNGGLIRDAGRWLRVGQRQGFGNYGEGALVYEITTLTASTYAERLVARVDPALLGRGSATHHLNTTGRVTVMDHKRWRHFHSSRQS